MTISKYFIADFGKITLYNINWFIFRYRGEEETPVYTFDSRAGVSPLSSSLYPALPVSVGAPGGSHFADRNLGSGRAFMRLTPTDARLTLDPVQADDEGSYHCKADFKRSASRTTYVNLTVIGKFIQSIYYICTYNQYLEINLS